LRNKATNFKPIKTQGKRKVWTDKNLATTTIWFIILPKKKKQQKFVKKVVMILYRAEFVRWSSLFKFIIASIRREASPSPPRGVYTMYR